MGLQSQAMIERRWQDSDIWTTCRVPPHKQFDYWREFVIDAHMHWTIQPVKCDCFPAFVRQGRCDGFRVTHLTAPQGGVVGTRGRREIAQDDESFYNLIYVAEGSICLVSGNQEVPLSPGTFTLWDTTRPMTFVTGEGLRQITFCVPQAQLHRVLPGADDFVGRRVTADVGVARLLADHLLSLDACFGELPQSGARGVIDATTELLASTLAASMWPMEKRATVLLRQVQTYIGQHLEDPDLTTERIAHENEISERHLQRLFAQAGATPSRWLRRQRLERCRHDLLANRTADLNITDIAFRWGFRDSGTFSKIFKREYGLRPSDLRARALRNSPIP